MSESSNGPEQRGGFFKRFFGGGTFSLPGEANPATNADQNAHFPQSQGGGQMPGTTPESFGYQSPAPAPKEPAQPKQNPQGGNQAA